MDGEAWEAAVHGVAKSRTRLRDFTCTFHFHALEKEMATHSSVLAWRIPGSLAGKRSTCETTKDVHESIQGITEDDEPAELGLGLASKET